MRYYQFSIRGESHLGVETSEDTLFDLTSANPHATDLFSLLRAASLLGVSLDHVARQIVDRGIASTLLVVWLILGFVWDSEPDLFDVRQNAQSDGELFTGSTTVSTLT
ncbi:MAG: DUF2333 family protein, partial [Dehalococcoidia bacterium]|nr:DUF2333 family protein [Dehalococcoidia bacterium]